MFTKDTKVWEKMKKNLTKGSNLEAQVGWFENAVYGEENDNLQVAQVAQWNEEGSLTNPPRPFIRMGWGLQIKKGIYNAYFKESINNILEGKSTFSKEYAQLNKVFVPDLKEVIEDWDTPPNSPRTIEEKGFNDPLIWTGTMHDTVDGRVAKRGSG